MKKQYIRPVVEVNVTFVPDMICSSLVFGGDGNGKPAEIKGFEEDDLESDGGAISSPWDDVWQ